MQNFWKHTREFTNFYYSAKQEKVKVIIGLRYLLPFRILFNEVKCIFIERDIPRNSYYEFSVILVDIFERVIKQWTVTF